MTRAHAYNSGNSRVFLLGSNALDRGLRTEKSSPPMSTGHENGEDRQVERAIRLKELLCAILTAGPVLLSKAVLPSRGQSTTSN